MFRAITKRSFFSCRTITVAATGAAVNSSRQSVRIARSLRRNPVLPAPLAPHRPESALREAPMCDDIRICILSHGDSPIIPDICMNCQVNKRFSVSVRNILPRVALFSYTIYNSLSCSLLYNSISGVADPLILGYFLLGLLCFLVLSGMFYLSGNIRLPG